MRELEELQAGLEDAEGPGRPDRRFEPPQDNVVAALAAVKLLPAIWFIFSRRGCEEAVINLCRRGVALTTDVSAHRYHHLCSSLPGIFAGISCHSIRS